MMSAIEIYNKPIFEYRDECVAILLLNAWELLLKAILSKNNQSVFYPKKRKEPYRTLSWRDAFSKAVKYFHASIGQVAVRENLNLLGTFRDNSVHFYNAKDIGVLLFALTQTSIKNYRDLMNAIFGIKLEEEINWQLLPVGIKPPVDVVSYISGSASEIASTAVRQYLAALARAKDEVKAAKEDSGRLLTVFNVKLESVKKIGDADVVVGIAKKDVDSGPLTVIRTQDPNITHPLRQMDVVKKIDTLHGKKFTSYTFQSIAWKHHLKEDPRYCWQAKDGFLTRYSNDVITFVNSLTHADLDAALTDYRAFHRSRSKRRMGST